MLELFSREDWPDQSTWYRWLRNEPDHARRYARAQMHRADGLMLEAMGKVDDVDPDSKYGNARVAKARAQVEVRKAFAQRLSKRWADKSAVELEGGPEPIKTVPVPPAPDVAKRIGEILQEVGAV